MVSFETPFYYLYAYAQITKPLLVIQRKLFAFLYIWLHYDLILSLKVSQTGRIGQKGNKCLLSWKGKLENIGEKPSLLAGLKPGPFNPESGALAAWLHNHPLVIQSFPHMHIKF